VLAQYYSPTILDFSRSKLTADLPCYTSDI